MTIHFRPLIKKGKAITYIDDALLQADTKEEMFEVISEYHKLLRKANLKAAPEKSFYFLKKVQFLGHIVSSENSVTTLSPVNKRVTELQNLKKPENKRDVMKLLGSVNFYQTYIRNLHLKCKPLYDLIKDEAVFEWTKEHDDCLEDIKKSIVNDVSLVVPKTNYPYFIHVDSSSIGCGAILIQKFPDGNKIVSFNSRIFTPQEQKLSTLMRELTGIIWALQTYEFFVIGSKHPITILTDHKPILYLFSKRGNMNHRFFRYQLILTKFQNLHIQWVDGKYLPIPDLLSRNYTVRHKDKEQLRHKAIPKEIRFFDNMGEKVEYKVIHTKEHPKNYSKFFPISAKKPKEPAQILQLNDDEKMVFSSETNYPINIKNHDQLFICTIFRNPKIVSQLANEDYCGSDNIEQPIWRNNSENLNYQPKQNGEINSQLDYAKNYELTQVQEKDTIIPRCNIELTPKVIAEHQRNDDVLKKVITWIETKLPPKMAIPKYDRAVNSYLQQYNSLVIDEGTNVLCRKYKGNTQICVPKSLFEEVFKKCHSDKLAGHFGFTKTVAQIQLNFYWPGMYRVIRAMNTACVDCARNKKGKKWQNTAALQPFGETIERPLQCIHIDHVGPLQPPAFGKKHCLTIIDAFSSFMWAIPVSSTDTETTINALNNELFYKVGFPESIAHDRGTAFMSKDFQQYCSELGIKLRPRTAYAPWSNGKIETMHSHLSRYVRTFISENGKNWPTLIPQFIFAYNTNINTSTGMSPYEILYGIKPSVPSTFKLGTFRKYNRTCDTQDPESFCYGLPQHTHEKPSLALNPHSQTFQAPLISQNILKRENQFKHIYSKAYQNSRKKFAQAHKYHNSHSLAKPLQIGSQVLLENHQIIPNLSKKFHQLRIGPLIIKDKPTEVTYNLIDPQTQKTYQAHRNHLIPYIPFKEYSKDLIEYNKKFPIQNYRTQQLNKQNQQTKQVRFNDQSEIIPDTYPQTPRQIIKPFQTPVGMGSPKYRLNYQAPPLLLTPATSRDHTAYQATPLRKTTPRYSATPLPTQIHPTQYQTPASIIRGNYSPIINSNRIPLFFIKNANS